MSLGLIAVSRALIIILMKKHIPPYCFRIYCFLLLLHIFLSCYALKFSMIIFS
jgi:hypothetical protein